MEENLQSVKSVQCLVSLLENSDGLYETYKETLALIAVAQATQLLTAVVDATALSKAYYQLSPYITLNSLGAASPTQKYITLLKRANSLDKAKAVFGNLHNLISVDTATQTACDACYTRLMKKADTKNARALFTLFQGKESTEKLAIGLKNRYINLLKEANSLNKAKAIFSNLYDLISVDTATQTACDACYAKLLAQANNPSEAKEIHTVFVPETTAGNTATPPLIDVPANHIKAAQKACLEQIAPIEQNAWTRDVKKIPTTFAFFNKDVVTAHTVAFVKALIDKCATSTHVCNIVNQYPGAKSDIEAARDAKDTYFKKAEWDTIKDASLEDILKAEERLSFVHEKLPALKLKRQIAKQVGSYQAAGCSRLFRHETREHQTHLLSVISNPKGKLLSEQTLYALLWLTKMDVAYTASLNRPGLFGGPHSKLHSKLHQIKIPGKYVTQNLLRAAINEALDRNACSDPQLLMRFNAYVNNFTTENDPHSETISQQKRRATRAIKNSLTEHRTDVSFKLRAC